MLRVIQNTAAASAKSYYSQSDYYQEGQELEGRWGGRGAERLGLAGTVEKIAFDRLCDNLHPQTGEQLTARSRADRTVLYDFNFHAPKSVSIVQAITQDQRIVTAFQAAVRETMLDVEQDAQTRVRKNGQDHNRVVGNLSWAEFTHLTSRPTVEYPDPHLHIHACVFNQVYDSIENQWKAGQFRSLKRDALYYEALFHSRLANKLQELGYPIERTKTAWEIQGVTPALIQQFSKRTAEIEKLAADKGITDPKQKDQLGAKTRQGKLQQLTSTELREHWQQSLAATDFVKLQTLRQFGSTAQSEPHLASELLEYAKQHHFERSSVVPLRTILRTALKRGVGTTTVEQIRTALPKAEFLTKIVELQELATTAEVLKQEQSIVSFVRSTRGTCPAFNRHWQLERTWLNPAQIQVIEQVLNSKDRVQMIKGRAGTGKTTLMQEAVAQIERSGSQVFTFAPTAEASRGVLAQEGFSNAETVDQLLTNPKLQQSVQGQVLWVDEAGLLSTRQMKQLLTLAEREDCRVILSGDWTQHGSVERGGAMRLIAQYAGIKVAKLQTIQRQRGQYREAVKLISNGKLDEGLQQLDELGWIKEIPSVDRYQQLAQDYLQAQQLQQTVLAIAPTHAEGHAITTAIREQLKAVEALGPERQIKRLVATNLTTAERSDPVQYQAGDLIQFVKPAKGFRKGTRLAITEAPAVELLQQADRFQLYRQEELAIAPGEWIRITANGQSQDGHRLNNGALYQVAKFTNTGDLQLTNGWIIPQDYGHLSYGYCLTSHSAQGKTVDRVLIAQGTASINATNREQFYVSVSRGRQQATIYTDDKQQFQQAITKSNEQLLAKELFTPHSPLQKARALWQRWHNLRQSRDLARQRPREQLPSPHLSPTRTVTYER